VVVHGLLVEEIETQEIAHALVERLLVDRDAWSGVRRGHDGLVAFIVVFCSRGSEGHNPPGCHSGAFAGRGPGCPEAAMVIWSGLVGFNQYRREGIMSEIGAYAAKTHLAELLERVRLGERFIITKHGEPIAELRP